MISAFLMLIHLGIRWKLSKDAVLMLVDEMALGHLIYPFLIIRFVGLTLILGKITGKTDTALHYKRVKREGINARSFQKLPC